MTDPMPDTEYCWLMTLQWNPTPSATHTNTMSGTTGFAPGTPRLDVYRTLFDYCRTELQVPATCNPVTLYFSLEPNRLG